MKTTEIKRILLPTDFSETGILAMEHAVYMARLFKAHLYLLHVVETSNYIYSEYESDAMREDIEDMYAIAEMKLKESAEKISRKNPIGVSTLISNGRPASSITKVVKEHEIDAIIMGTHGAKGFEEYFVGSNAQKVVNLALCPVITIQKHAKKIGFRDIIMPIGSSLYSREKVNYVRLLASAYKSKVHILGLLSSNKDIDEKRFNIKMDSVENALKNANINYVRKTVKGLNIAAMAMKYSDRIEAGLIVIRTDYESVLNGALISSFARQIVNHSRVPVMSIPLMSEVHPDKISLSNASSLVINGN